MQETQQELAVRLAQQANEKIAQLRRLCPGLFQVTVTYDLDQVVKYVSPFASVPVAIA